MALTAAAFALNGNAWPPLPPECDNALTAFAFLTRSPYSWLVAMHSEPYEHDGAVPLSFSEFLAERLRSCGARVQRVFYRGLG